MESNKKEIWGPWATAGLGFFVLIAWCVAQAIPFLVVWGLRLHDNGGKQAASLLKSLQENGDVIAMAATFGSLVGFGALWLAVWLRRGAKLPEYVGLQPFKMKSLPGILGISVAFFLASDLLSYSLGKDLVPQFMVDVCSTCTTPILLILGMVLLGPSFEEFFFRGFLLEGLRNSKLGNVGAVLLVTAAWACLHTQYDLYGVATVFASGLLIAYFRLRTGSLWSSILIHLLMNAWATVEAVLYFHGFTIFHLSKA